VLKEGTAKTSSIFAGGLQGNFVSGPPVGGFGGRGGGSPGQLK